MHSQIETWNQMILNGRGRHVAKALAHVPRGKVPLELLSQIANLAWRVNSPLVGIRLLHPELKRHHYLKSKVPHQALAEYCACLIEIGAVAEAERHLKTIVNEVPKAQFYLALLALKEWDNQKAISLLEPYFHSLEPSYHRSVVQLNLAASCVSESEYERARPLLTDLKQRLKEEDRKMLLGNTLEVAAQIDFAEKNYAAALDMLSESEKLLESSLNMGWLYAKKWIFLNSIYKNSSVGEPLSLQDQERLEKLKQLAVEMKSWETLRELDFRVGLLTRNGELINRVYYGSPFVRFRHKIAIECQRHFSKNPLEDSYLLMPDKSLKAEVALEELVSGSLDEMHAFQIRNLMWILSSDLYAPFRTASLFSRLHPEDYYDLDSSPDRTFQVVKRLRQYIEKREIPLTIEFEPGGYKLCLKANTGLRIDRKWIELDKFEKGSVYNLLLEQAFGDREFTAAEVSQHFNCSKRSSNRIVEAVKESGKLRSIGAGPRTRYCRVS